MEELFREQLKKVYYGYPKFCLFDVMLDVEERAKDGKYKSITIEVLRELHG